MQDDIEFYSMKRAERSLRRADVVLLFFDPTQGISKIEKQLAASIAELYKPCVYVVNKWDLKLPTPTDKFANILYDQVRALPYSPAVFITARTGKNVKALLNLAQNLFKQAGARVTTGDLNRVIEQAVAANQPPMRENRQGKIYYATQVGVHPPTIVLFCNSPRLLDATYQRYLLSVLHERLPFREVPIKMYLRRRRDVGLGPSSDESTGAGPLHNPTSDADPAQT